jgi:hypothetical protein
MLSCPLLKFLSLAAVRSELGDGELRATRVQKSLSRSRMRMRLRPVGPRRSATRRPSARCWAAWPSAATGWPPSAPTRPAAGAAGGGGGGGADAAAGASGGGRGRRCPGRCRQKTLQCRKQPVSFLSLFQFWLFRAHKL